MNGIDNNKNIGPLLDYIYPVGSIYMSINPADPSTLFGGVWVKLQEGVVVLSSGDTYTAGSTGGEASHAITEAEMPSHSHGGSTETEGLHEHEVEHYAPPSTWTASAVSMQASSGECGYIGCLETSQANFTSGEAWLSKSTNSKNPNSYSRLTEAGSHSHTFTTDATGGKEDGTTQPMSLIQPYFSAYIWYRTA